MQRYDKVLADFNRAIELDPADALDIASRGETYRRMGRYEEALADFSRAIELNPRLRLGHHQPRPADYSRATELDPGLSDMLAYVLAFMRGELPAGS